MPGPPGDPRSSAPPFCGRLGAMPEASRARFGTCPAPKILTADVCNRFLERGQDTCHVHAGTDPTRQCQAETGPSGARVPCQGWPLVDLPYCSAHAPQRKAERRAEREALAVQLAQLRKLVTPRVGVK